MLIGFLGWYAEACHSANFADRGTRYNVLHILVPRLARERRELLQGLAQQRKHSRPLPPEYRRLVLEDVADCRRAIQAARRRAREHGHG
jgi:hypothetical protein